MVPEAILQPLQRADGSASYSYHGYSVIAAVNGPVEVQRRDELPEEAAVEVIIRPTVGVGGVRERYLESIVHKTLRHVILTKAHPRTLIQVTLQVLGTPRSEAGSRGLSQAALDLPLLPSLLQSAMLGLLAASIPLGSMLTSTVLAVDADGVLLSDPTPKQLQQAASVHVFAFASGGNLLVAESEGDFNIDIWEMAEDKARGVCMGRQEGEDVGMEGQEEGGLERLVVDSVARKVATEQRWKEGIE